MAFQGFLRADTPVRVVIGPVEALDNTAVTSLALPAADVAEVLKHSDTSAMDISRRTFTAILGMDGYYNLTLTKADVELEGMLAVGISDASLCRPIRTSFMVVDADVYDALYAGVGRLQTNTVEIGGEKAAADNAKLAFNGAGYAFAGCSMPSMLSLEGHTPQSGDSYAVVADKRYGNAQLVRSTAPHHTLDISAGGQAGVDWANVGGQDAEVDLSATSIGRCDSVMDLAGHTPQTGDTYAALPPNFSGLAIIAGAVVVERNNDKDGYGLVLDQESVTVGTVNALTGHVGQSGDTYAALPEGVSELRIMDGCVIVGASMDKEGYELAPDQAGVTIGTVSMLAGHTPQTGNSYAVVTNGTYGNAQLVRATDPTQTLDVNEDGQVGVDLDNASGTLAKDKDVVGFNDLSVAAVKHIVLDVLDKPPREVPTAKGALEL